MLEFRATLIHGSADLTACLSPCRLRASIVLAGSKPQEPGPCRESKGCLVTMSFATTTLKFWTGLDAPFSTQAIYTLEPALLFPCPAIANLCRSFHPQLEIWSIPLMPSSI